MSNSEGIQENVTMPVNVYCSLVRCALQNSTLGFQSSLLNPLNGRTNTNLGFNTTTNFGNNTEKPLKIDGLNSTINCLMKLSNSEVEGLDTHTMPMPPDAKRGNLQGDLKDSLDRVKSELFDHYSFYYNLQEYDIPTRLELLSLHSVPNGESIFYNYIIRQLDKSNSNVMDMLEGLKNKFESINERIYVLEDELNNEVSDPNVREYQYSSATKNVLGLDDMDDLENMKEHIHNLYSHLHHQSKLNQKKIQVLQQKLLTLTAHTRLINQRQPNDKRNGL
ncbi:conserved hypothetical protein [Theileria orientalis strain Shintoku]|uniref:Uncharacterized protein n=1 Tax=Theileria orientalis strain Shintoku TaxID=869250 RepID=J4C8U0_THEOR|nr:conserved hypothetical protein [Theileria orientalis strain Shintoku]BAM41373.1 conserved hypothetical protein [Theileria orientalis strain Shintoku]|eukprot:XP_009691674.1 conserved hypothetical protein [Theileria orientalis strain Shintoku]